MSGLCRPTDAAKVGTATRSAMTSEHVSLFKSDYRTIRKVRLVNMSIILLLGRLRQEHHFAFRTILNYIVSSRLASAPE